MFKQIIEVANKKRNGFANAIGLGKSSAICESFPNEIKELYKVAAGTERSIEEQELMDFVPGFRFIHFSELENETKNLHKGYPELLNHVPILADYSSCFFTFSKDTKEIFTVDPQWPKVAISKSVDKFLETILRFYEEVYFLDEDGYLDYDLDKESEIGSKVNPEYKYWKES